MHQDITYIVMISLCFQCFQFLTPLINALSHQSFTFLEPLNKVTDPQGVLGPWDTERFLLQLLPHTKVLCVFFYSFGVFSVNLQFQYS